MVNLAKKIPAHAPRRIEPTRMSQPTHYADSLFKKTEYMKPMKSTVTVIVVIKQMAGLKTFLPAKAKKRPKTMRKAPKTYALSFKKFQTWLNLKAGQAVSLSKEMTGWQLSELSSLKPCELLLG